MKVSNGWKLVIVYAVSVLVVGPLVYAGKLHEAYLIALLVAGVPGFLSNVTSKTPNPYASIAPPPETSIARAAEDTPAETPDAKKGK